MILLPSASIASQAPPCFGGCGRKAEASWSRIMNGCAECLEFFVSKRPELCSRPLCGRRAVLFADQCLPHWMPRIAA